MALVRRMPLVQRSCQIYCDAAAELCAFAFPDGNGGTVLMAGFEVVRHLVDGGEQEELKAGLPTIRPQHWTSWVTSILCSLSLVVQGHQLGCSHGLPELLTR